MDFDTDSCYNSVAVGPDLFLNEGLDSCGGCPECGCRDRVNLDRSNNVYSRARCNGEWCAYMYAYYFEKDYAAGCGSGHRHDWEHVVVWVKNDKAEWVAASRHGKFEVKSRGDVRWDGTHPKIVCKLALVPSSASRPSITSIKQKYRPQGRRQHTCHAVCHGRR